MFSESQLSDEDQPIAGKDNRADNLYGGEKKMCLNNTYRVVHVCYHLREIVVKTVLSVI